MAAAPDPATFDRIEALVRGIGYPVIETGDDPHAFGSWAITVMTDRGPIRIVLDGREGEVLLQRLAAGADRGEAPAEPLWFSSADRTPASKVLKRLQQTAAPAAPPAG